MMTNDMVVFTVHECGLACHHLRQYDCTVRLKSPINKVVFESRLPSPETIPIFISVSPIFIGISTSTSTSISIFIYTPISVFVSVSVSVSPSPVATQVHFQCRFVLHDVAQSGPFILHPISLRLRHGHTRPLKKRSTISLIRRFRSIDPTWDILHSACFCVWCRCSLLQLALAWPHPRSPSILGSSCICTSDI